MLCSIPVTQKSKGKIQVSMFVRRKLYEKSTRENVSVPFVNTQPSVMAGKYLQGKCRFKVFVPYHHFMIGTGSKASDILTLPDEGKKEATSESMFLTLICLIYKETAIEDRKRQ